ncbi:UDP-glycosyltransferase 79B30-like [Momordica charantia]|uniref:Glycosyltransferase n=1 Tax=Momordica charantia TaxID=3673 RepID=A0A6J1C2T5_MOMCH|nr:UDP-glycosyltransferase 79B30-like [Momordica charantia]
MAASPMETLHIAMYPWFALGHLTPFLHLSNKLAKKGHKISFFIPTKTLPKLQPLNLFPNLITLIPITIPHVDGLPPAVETTSDVPYPLHTLIMTAMDRTEPELKLLLQAHRPHIILFDFTHWLPRLARQLGIKSIHYCVTSAAMIGYTLTPSRQFSKDELTEEDLIQPPIGYPSSTINLHLHEARAFASKRKWKFGSDILFYDRQFISFSDCDAIGFRTCHEIEGDFVTYLQKEFKKPILLSGPVLPEPLATNLEEKLETWLSGFEEGSMIYCAFGSECTLKKEQFQELLLGFELSGMPFFAALKPPFGEDTIEAALPAEFARRVGGRGVVFGGWVQQERILEHPCVGCFVTHCGSGSLSEALVNKCQLVLLPQVGDQIINARMMGRNLGVGVEVEKGEEDGWFSKESVCKAVKIVMDEGNEIGKQVRRSHAQIRDLLLKKDLEESYIYSFSQSLCDLVG